MTAQIFTKQETVHSGNHADDATVLAVSANRVSRSDEARTLTGYSNRAVSEEGEETSKDGAQSLSTQEGYRALLATPEELVQQKASPVAKRVCTSSELSGSDGNQFQKSARAERPALPGTEQMVKCAKCGDPRPAHKLQRGLCYFCSELGVPQRFQQQRPTQTISS